jgi:hypothetical protein
MDTFSMEELLALEKSGWDALCESRGADYYGEIMTSDAVMVLVNGMTLDRDAVRASLNAAPPWDSYDITDARVVAAGRGAAALVYRARAERVGEAPFEALMSSVYAEVDGKLRLALYQQTTVTH